MRELAPDVLAALRRTLTEPEGEPRRYAMLALLDAAIRLDVRLSTEDLAACNLTTFHSQVLFLASRDPGAHTKLLESLRENPWGPQRTAADNLLAVGAPDRAVELLLPEARVHLHVRVSDPGGYLKPERHTAGAGCGRERVPEHFPPTAFYRLVDGPAKGAEVFADGPQPIAVDRTVHTQRKISTSSGFYSFDASQHALDLLRWISGDRAQESPLAAEIGVRHDWTNATGYVAKVGEEIRTRHDAWRKLVDALVARELLPAERVPTADPIEVEVEDLRKDQRVPLPELPR